MAIFTRDYSDEPIEGTEDFIEVASAHSGGWEWAEFGVYYSPRAGRFYWLSESGCSCSSFADSITSVGDFQDGDRAAAIRAAKAEVVVSSSDPYEGFTSEQRQSVLHDLATFDTASADKWATA